MTALAEALVAAQRRAVQVLEKAYVAGSVDPDELIAQLCLIGLTDAVDTAALIASLNVLREHGGPLPAAAVGNGAAAPKPPEPATDKQRVGIRTRMTTKYPDAEVHALASEPTLTKDLASEIITALDAGTFELDKYRVPF